jgi:hypothetical protein
METWQNFTDEQIEGGVLYTFACLHAEAAQEVNDQVQDGTVSIEEDGLAEIQSICRAVEDALHYLYADPTDALAHALPSVRAGYTLLKLNPQLQLSSEDHDEIRERFISRFPVSQATITVWPPTKQTVAKRFGDGLWAQALTYLGFELQGRGVPRRRFNKKQAHEGIEMFISHCLIFNRYPTEAEYVSWCGNHYPDLEFVKKTFGSLHKAVWQIYDGDPYTLLPTDTKDFM